MNEQATQLEQLSVELFRLVFEYFAPQELFQAFENLNNRITTILGQQPLCLPSNKNMPLNLYMDYISKMNIYAPQIVYLHLSERYAPHAVDEFFFKISNDSIDLPLLKAVTVDDVFPTTYILLFNESSPFSGIYSLTVIMNQNCYHYSDYNSSLDIDYILPLLNNLPQLRSLYLRMSPRVDSYYIKELDQFVPQINTHFNLHTLSINDCSRRLFVELLKYGRLPKLCRLDVVFSDPEYFDFAAEHLCTIPIQPPIPFKQVCLPELRYVDVRLTDDLTGMLTYFDDIHRHSQLEKFNITGYINISKKGNLPRPHDLRQWLTMSKLKEFIFRMNLSLTYTDENDKEYLETMLTEYRKATGINSPDHSGQLFILYPTMSLIPSSERDEIESMDDSNDQSTDDDVYYLCNEYSDELDISKSDFEDEKIIQTIKAISYWPYLHKITLHGDSFNDMDSVEATILHLLHIAQRAPRFSQLSINAHDPFDSMSVNDDDIGNRLPIQFGSLLSNNVELGIILATKLGMFTFNGEFADCPFLGVAQIVDKLFSHSLTSPILKWLKLEVGAHPSSWLTVHHLVQATDLLFNRFPALIHLSLECHPDQAFNETIYDFSNFVEKWYVKWTRLQSKRGMHRILNYRHRFNSLDVWL